MMPVSGSNQKNSSLLPPPSAMQLPFAGAPWAEDPAWAARRAAFMACRSVCVCVRVCVRVCACVCVGLNVGLRS